MKLKPSEIKKRYEKANSRKDQWRSIYEDAYRYCLPNRNLYDGYYESNAPGQDKMNKVFDSTAIQSTHRFANRLQSGVFPPQRNWCRLVPGEEIPAERQVEIQQILDVYTDTMFGVLRQSNFDMAIGEFLLELAVGTAVMLIQPGTETQPIRFTCIPTFLVSFEEGPFGSVDKVYRRMKKPYGTLDQEFPDITIPPEMQQRYQNDETEMVELIEATCYDKDLGIYHYQIVDEAGQTELLHRELQSFPWVIGRYMVASSEIYGRGPCLTALPDIRSLNRTIELTLKNASLSISGVFTASDDGVLNPSTIQMLPGAIIPVARNGGPMGASLAPLPRSGDPQLSQIVANDLRTSIKRILMDESLAPENMSARSATEINAKLAELSQNMGSAFGRLINETMYPIVRRTLETMDEMGMINLPLRVNGLQVRVIPSAPLAQAQNIEKVQEALQFASVAQQAGPVGQFVLKPEKLLDYVAKMMGIPSELITTPQERVEMQKQAMQMAQQQMELQQQQQMAQGGQGGPNPQAPLQ